MQISRRRTGLVLTALVPLALASLGAAEPAIANSCTLEYQRADNMWAAAGRPDGNLGVESIMLDAGQTKALVTSWTYEKKRNDGKTYYGSHLRVAENKSTRTVKMVIDEGAFIWGSEARKTVYIDPGKRQEFRADLFAVTCG